MIHPSPLAIDFIWSRLRRTYLCQSTDEPIADFGALANALAHRPESGATDAHIKFAGAQLRKVNRELPFCASTNKE